MGDMKIFNGVRTYTFDGGRDYEVAGLDDIQALQQVLDGTTTKLSTQVTPTAGGNTVTIPSLTGNYILLIIRSPSTIYTIGNTLNEVTKKCTISGNTITFPNNFGANESVFVVYQGIVGNTYTTTVLQVDTYEDMLIEATGNRVLQIFVTEASQYNEANEFYTYIPNIGIGYLGIDFNYTE